MQLLPTKLDASLPYYPKLLESFPNCEHLFLSRKSEDT